MTDENPHDHDFLQQGFALESADSVRFGGDYTPEERERNRQILLGELLCGLLMGEPIWTNAVFAFDSQGLVEVLGAVARAFPRVGETEQFLPLIIAAYPADRVPELAAPRPWQNPNEFFLRCYAHRLDNVAGFTLSATPQLQTDERRRKTIAQVLVQHAEQRVASRFDGFPVELTAEEATHFRDVYSIDSFLRSWFRGAGGTTFADYVQAPLPDHPVRGIRTRSRFDPASDAKSLRAFCERAVNLATAANDGDQLAEAAGILREELAKPNNPGFGSRSTFRQMLAPVRNSPAYRTLVELADGHYVRMQYTELTYSAREVTSPASNEAASELGERWATQTMRSLLSHCDSVRPWQFVNRICVRPSARVRSLNLDEIAQRFADYMRSPERRSDLRTYHELLHLARKSLSDPAAHDDDRERHCDALYDHVDTCRDHINAHMAGTGVAFSFNPSDPRTHAGTLSLSYQDNESISQLTGPPDATLQLADSDHQVASRGTNSEFDVGVPKPHGSRTVK